MTPKQKNVIAYRFHSMIDALSAILPPVEARAIALVISAMSSDESILGPRASWIIEDAFNVERFQPGTVKHTEAIHHLYDEAVRYFMDGKSVQFDNEELAESAVSAIRKHPRWDPKSSWSLTHVPPTTKNMDNPCRILTFRHMEM